MKPDWGHCHQLPRIVRDTVTGWSGWSRWSGRSVAVFVASRPLSPRGHVVVVGVVAVVRAFLVVVAGAAGSGELLVAVAGAAAGVELLVVAGASRGRCPGPR